MKGITPWETLDNFSFHEQIKWEFTCSGKKVKNYNELKDFWLPDEHDLYVSVLIGINLNDEKILRVLSSKKTPKWMLCWRSSGTKIGGSSELFFSEENEIEISCLIPKGSCTKNLILEPVAIRTDQIINIDGTYNPPPGAILTRLDSIEIVFGKEQIFPIYEKYGDGKKLFNWRVPSDISQELDEDIVHIISVEIDLNHPLIIEFNGESEMSKKQKSGLIYQKIIHDYLIILLSNTELIKAIDERNTFSIGSLGASINWILNILTSHAGLSTVKEFKELLNNKPLVLSEIVDEIFSQHLI